MKPEDHIKRYKQMRNTLNELLAKPTQERDHASIVIIAHWASYHLISTIIDQLGIPEQFQHRNHRGIKKSLKAAQIQEIIGNDANKILNLYNLLEMNFSAKFQYGSIESVPDYKELSKILKDLENICKNITEKVQKDIAK
ncbi:MAG: hypothetical protein EU532_10915 [Promethearchaeota archaeon]|nr:MAG: hypothetical protein EU532_10915 [Candidatus Lokiarchaeota archaeon]